MASLEHVKVGDEVVIRSLFGDPLKVVTITGETPTLLKFGPSLEDRIRKSNGSLLDKEGRWASVPTPDLLEKVKQREDTERLQKTKKDAWQRLHRVLCNLQALDYQKVPTDKLVALSIDLEYMLAKARGGKNND